MKRNPFVYILILNWNGWEDTIECLESVFRLNYSNFKVVVCDNASNDDSFTYIKSWAKGELCSFVHPSNSLRKYSLPPISKPISYHELHNHAIDELDNKAEATTQLILIQTGDNLGFAGGNNVGLRYVKNRNDFEYVWLLNNDTVVDPNSLTHMINRFEKNRTCQKNVGIMGSMLRYYHSPRKIQAVCGKYNPILATSQHLGMGEEDRGQWKHADYEPDYTVGASMMVSKDFLLEVGELCEDYFLYFEELDWAKRGAQKDYELDSCSEAIVFHKEGSSIGSSSEWKNRSVIAEYYGLRNRIVFTKKFYPQYLLTVYLGFLGVILNRIRRRQFKRIGLVLKAIIGKRSPMLRASTKREKISN
jgi:hypothetical protein